MPIGLTYALTHKWTLRNFQCSISCRETQLKRCFYRLLLNFNLRKLTKLLSLVYLLTTPHAKLLRMTAGKMDSSHFDYLQFSKQRKFDAPSKSRFSIIECGMRSVILVIYQRQITRKGNEFEYFSVFFPCYLKVLYQHTTSIQTTSSKLKPWNSNEGRWSKSFVLRYYQVEPSIQL